MDPAGTSKKRDAQEASLRPADAKPAGPAVDESELVARMQLYYGRLFPFSAMFRWLSYGGDLDYFHKREFSYTLKGDIYCRYQSYLSMEAFRDDIRARNPEKIDIGAVFSDSPANHKTVASGFRPVERELVFDIDMTDYDPIRTCCSGAAVCTRCWRWMAAAIRVLDRVLREDFGFNHLLWVFSGRRGVHCWVCDAAARKLSAEQRAAVADYLHVFSTGDVRQVLNRNSRIFPFLRRVCDEILEPLLREHILGEQELLDDPARAAPLLGMIPDDGVRADLHAAWFESSKPPKAPERWDQLRKRVERAAKSATGAQRDALNACVYEIVLWYTYPRLDINVSKGLNHLLKAPFCVHPKTGKVCVPLSPDRCEAFNPLTDPPSVFALPEEIGAYDAAHAGSDDGARIKDWKKTSLRPYIEHFKREFLFPLLRESVRAREAARDRMDF